MPSGPYSTTLFQFTPPRGGRRQQDLPVFVSSNFNSRPRVGGDVESIVQAQQELDDFNSRPRVGGDAAPGAPPGPVGISIHAPAWGATAAPGKGRPPSILFQFTPPRGGRLRGICREVQTEAISIHAPAWGATAAAGGSARGLYDFNSRPRVGGDLNGQVVQQLVHISIHAPAWGATMMGAKAAEKALFQFTPPRGGRRILSPTASTGATYFNSRPRVGGDHIQVDGAVALVTISIHAPAWGATLPRRLHHQAPPISIHAPAWGATGGVPLQKLCRQISIHAPAWGATQKSGSSANCKKFQFTPPRGGRL